MGKFTKRYLIGIALLGCVIALVESGFNPSEPTKMSLDTKNVIAERNLRGGAREIHTGRFKGRHRGHMVHYTRYGLPSKYKADRYRAWRNHQYWDGDRGWDRPTYWRGNYWDHPRWYHPYWHDYWYGDGNGDWGGYPGFYFDPNFYYTEYDTPSIPYGRPYVGFRDENPSFYPEEGFEDDGIHSEVIR